MTLQEFFKACPRAAVAFSGGVDSAYLLYAAKRCGAQVRAYYASSEFQPAFELADARRLAARLNAELCVLPLRLLEDARIRANPADRCYHCKKRIFSEILSAAASDGFFVLLDGTNASDAADDRPGMRALQELSVRSPLRECGLTKAHIRQLSREAGLFTWDKPAYACLATRIPAGEALTAEKLRTTETAEELLFALGFSDLRVRCRDGHARLQVPKAQLALVLQRREEILARLRPLYKTISLDLEARE